MEMRVIQKQAEISDKAARRNRQHFANKGNSIHYPSCCEILHPSYEYQSSFGMTLETVNINEGIVSILKTMMPCSLSKIINESPCE